MACFHFLKPELLSEDVMESLDNERMIVTLVRFFYIPIAQSNRIADFFQLLFSPNIT
ncbi:hypothetical protein GCM10007111_10200 [Virgibacillus kapii]|uniref:Uncharacterized protein n=1 Tax=Virgibacillus kapii TaxID=1638645 RepID=A0ABQ2DCQ9_9BACI|nr:hypothetical protein GCM10007111_10200 [Virgibacillus kapii]